MIIVVLAADRHHRPHPEGADLDLPVVLPRRRRHGEGAALARTHASRPDAHLQCHAGADLLEAARAGLRALPVHLDEGGGGGEPRRRHRRRTADRARSPASARNCSPASYYSQTIDIWAALVAGSVVAALLVVLVGHRRPDRRARHGSAARMIDIAVFTRSSPPPLTPPHKGEGGIDRCAPLATLACHSAAMTSPSPLWGGVRGGGELTSPRGAQPS